MGWASSSFRRTGERWRMTSWCLGLGFPWMKDPELPECPSHNTLLFFLWGALFTFWRQRQWKNSSAKCLWIPAADLVLGLFLFYGAGNGTQGLAHALPAPCIWAQPSCPWISGARHWSVVWAGLRISSSSRALNKERQKDSEEAMGSACTFLSGCL